MTLLDGGLATELERRGLDLSDELWSARCLIDHPETIVAVHLDYLRAGADCLITASYQATFEGFRRRGLSPAASEELMARAVDLARQARDDFRREFPERRPLIAASIGPYGAALADGSEYTGRYDLGEDGLLEFHRRRFELSANSGADCLACETIPSAAEARVLARLLRDAAIPGWISFSCEGGRLRDGSKLEEVVREAIDLSGDRWIAVGVNCLPPDQVLRHLELLNSTGLPLIAYPNSGESWDALARKWREDPIEAPTSLARRWYDAGARWIGGCCRTTPETIRALRRQFPADAFRPASASSIRSRTPGSDV